MCSIAPNKLHNNFKLSYAEGVGYVVQSSHLKIEEIQQSHGDTPQTFLNFLWSATYDRENRKVCCPGRTTSHSEKKIKGVAAHTSAKLGITVTRSKVMPNANDTVH